MAAPSNSPRRLSCYLALLTFLSHARPGTSWKCEQNEYDWVINSVEGCCPKCPAGHYLKERCKMFNTKAVCTVCPTGTYAESWNTYESCAPCRECLRENGLQVEKECNGKLNVKCTCRPGYKLSDYIHQNQCSKICEKGHQLKPGDLHTCEPCPAGFYADDKGTKSCKPWTRCKGHGQKLIKNGSTTQDVECGSSEYSPTTPSKGFLFTSVPTYSTTLLRIKTDDSVTTGKPALMKNNLLFACVIIVAAVVLILVVLKNMKNCPEGNQGLKDCFKDRNYREHQVPVQEEFKDFTSVQVKN
ncbi:tumor necrosis factor receptor superfamily member 5-like [Narcine bancroftii]|uniref:tumor necrosis factor receptor superfamily member 5-like n=1 Tax=Narcine bancroftii TaxID=1343680 RepID=UPI00383200AF